MHDLRMSGSGSSRRRTHEADRGPSRQEHADIAQLAMAAEVGLVHEARAFATHLLVRHACTPDLVDDVRIVVDELVAKAVTHSGTDGITLTVANAGPCVLVVVSDTGTWLVHPKATSRTMAETGRGLDIVKALATGSGICKEPSGSCVWATLTASDTGRRQ
jgi:anti-sigma regulatory factor (Ser/Thr protein kinase)